ncbi:MAG TPA: EAL domain-containing protein [Rhodoferax sp.]|jgi:diguanylate cyclase (GGDEF)-like protein/PAS domain S-box-containing protein|nr:EAL domain-containing protein [Rhodoferax sp.]HOF50899.1 EAL domain-containing protein [Rhodoferax sp.]HPW84267.1 EAL domain-containing protein [Rhodoferax sp.]HQY76903.1 EAL domain-containing protein [Rhodoferax sp.]
MTDNNSPTPSADAVKQTLLEYQAILENASVGILFSRGRKVLHCNPRFSEIFGWEQGELVGQPATVLYFSPEDYSELGRLAGPVLARGELLDIERVMRRKDGSGVHCHLNSRAINPQNTAEGTIWIVEDIGERKRAETEMKDLMLKQQAILENASLGIMFTSNGHIVHCNPRVEAILNWPQGTLEGQKAGVFFSSMEDYALFGKQVGPQLARGELVDVSWLNQCKDGSTIWCRHLAKALTTTDGSKSTIWITEDISEKRAAQEALQKAHQELEQRVEQRTEELAAANTRLLSEIAERKQIENNLRASEARFRDLSELSSDWFWEQDADFRFVELMTGPRYTQLPPGDTYGKTRWELPILGVTPAQWEQHRALLAAHLPYREFIYQLELPDGERHWLSVSGKPIFDNGVFMGYRGTGTDITQRKATEQQIEYLAYHDPLTGLPNRMLLEDRMQQSLAHAERNHFRLALLFLDLDNFKKINDSLGHATGDILLKEIASRLGECVRDTDTISRQGGDEFVLILNDLPDPDACLPVLVKILNRLQDPFMADGNELSTSVSIGIAVYPEDGRDFETLRKKADMAMYRAKEAGRNTYHFFDDAMNDEAVEHLQMRNGLRRALERSELVLYYQPQIDLASGRVVGTEALLRWNHPDFGLVAPGRFIPIAEDSGLIVPIGEWVITEACRQAVAWQKAGLPALQMAVNLSAVQFKRGNVEQIVITALQQSGLAPSLLELELTESILIENVEQVLSTVKRLKQLGVKLSIDDFGTGYSSLSYLKRFDIDKLKIDQSFIRDLATDTDDAAIVNAVIQMARSLNLKTIAEGVEHPDMLDLLRGFQCDEVQGYYFARPMPADEFSAYLSGN